MEGVAGGKGYQHSCIILRVHQFAYILHQVSCQCHEIPYTEAAADPLYVEWSTKHRVLHGIQHTDSTGRFVFLGSDWKGLSTIREGRLWIIWRLAEQHPQPMSQAGAQCRCTLCCSTTGEGVACSTED